MSSVSTIGIVKAELSFPIDAEHGGWFNNNEPEKSQQFLESFEVEIADARTLDPPPAFDREGFSLVAHPVPEGDFFDQEWLDNVYNPSCVELVKRVTGAKDAFLFDGARIRTAGPREGKAKDAFVPAGFAHLDIPRPQCEQFARTIGEGWGKSFERGAIFNVWKLISPGPHDLPLTVADQRTIAPEDFAPGETRNTDAIAPYVAIVHAPAQKWYYYPDMTIADSLVFVGENFDPEKPLGSAHTAFRHPDVTAEIPRSSAEVRVVAVFE